MGQVEIKIIFRRSNWKIWLRGLVYLRDDLVAAAAAAAASRIIDRPGRLISYSNG
jgi:hypothetical protein